jgi:hypothetical protein
MGKYTKTLPRTKALKLRNHWEDTIINIMEKHEGIVIVCGFPQYLQITFYCKCSANIISARKYRNLHKLTYRHNTIQHRKNAIYTEMVMIINCYVKYKTAHHSAQYFALVYFSMENYNFLTNLLKFEVFPK